MLDGIKNIINLRSIDKNISNNEFDIAFEKLNTLIYDGECTEEAYLKRGLLCKKLLMTDDAYSDFTYIITHCKKKYEAYKERMYINFEIGNFSEAISDADWLVTNSENKFEFLRIKILSILYSSQKENAIEVISEIFEHKKYKILHFLFNETAEAMSANEHGKALKLLDAVDEFDENNPLKMLNEANIYFLAGQQEKQKEILQKIHLRNYVRK